MSYEIVWERDIQIKLGRSNDEGYIFDYSQNFDDLPKEFIKNGKYLVVGGAWDGRLLIFNLNEEFLEETYYE
jgi:hypothetical protein